MFQNKFGVSVKYYFFQNENERMFINPMMIFAICRDLSDLIGRLLER